MNKTHGLILASVALFWAAGRAAEKTPAQSRALSYQQEARAVLESRRWHIVRDESGKLVAHHTLGLMGAGVGGTQVFGLTATPLPSNAPLKVYAWLTLTFTPVSITQTKCAANIVSYTFWEGMTNGQREQVKPTPFNNPDATKEIQDMMAKAEAKMSKDHPEYAPR